MNLDPNPYSPANFNARTIPELRPAWRRVENINILTSADLARVLALKDDLGRRQNDIVLGRAGRRPDR